MFIFNFFQKDLSNIVPDYFPTLRKYFPQEQEYSSVTEEYVDITITKTQNSGSYSCPKSQAQEITEIEQEIQEYENLSDQVSISIKTSGPDQTIIDKYEDQLLAYSQHIRKLSGDLKLIIDQYCR